MKITVEDLRKLIFEETLLLRELQEDAPDQDEPVDEPVSEGGINAIYIFDFDDTLAVTDTLVGVGRPDGAEVEVGGPDRTFKEFLQANDIEWDEKVGGAGTADDPVFLDSFGFGVYEKVTVDQYGHDFRKKDIRDYSQAYYILNHDPLKNVLSILKDVSHRSDTEVAVVTARATVSSAFKDKEDNPVKGKNRDQIHDILSSAGVRIDPSDIYTTGDDRSGPGGETIRGGQPEDKLRVITTLVKKYQPKNLYFYDDQTKNLNKIMDLCGEQFPDLAIETFVVDPHSGEGSTSDGPECKSPVSEERWLKLAGLEKI